MEINFVDGRIKNLTTSAENFFEPVGEYMMNILQHGGIKSMIREQ